MLTKLSTDLYHGGRVFTGGNADRISAIEETMGMHVVQKWARRSLRSGRLVGRLRSQDRLDSTQQGLHTQPNHMLGLTPHRPRHTDSLIHYCCCMLLVKDGN